jgi:hypothetical protein
MKIVIEFSSDVRAACNVKLFYVKINDIYFRNSKPCFENIFQRHSIIDKSHAVLIVWNRLMELIIYNVGDRQSVLGDGQLWNAYNL